MLIDCGSVGGIAPSRERDREPPDRCCRCGRRQEAARPARGDARAQGPHRRLRSRLLREHQDRAHLDERRDGSAAPAGRTGARSCTALATTAMRNIAGLNLALESRARRNWSRSTASTTTRRWRRCATRCRQRNGITPTYVHAGMTPAQLGLAARRAPRSACSARNSDIDRFYLGEEADETLQRLMAAEAPRSGTHRCSRPTAYPANISLADFRRLQSRMMSSAFAFAELSSKVTNNTSVVLLIEWKRQAAAVRRRRRVGHEVQGGQGQRRVERDVARAKGRAATARSTS